VGGWGGGYDPVMRLLLPFGTPSTYCGAMIRYFRSLLEALQNIAIPMESVAALLLIVAEKSHSEGDVDGRVTALELSRTKWEAELEGLVAKAEGQYRAAANAEARARTHAKAAEVFEEGDEESAEDPFDVILRELRQPDGAGGEVDGVPPVLPLLAVPTLAAEARAANRARRKARG